MGILFPNGSGPWVWTMPSQPKNWSALLVDQGRPLLTKINLRKTPFLSVVSKKAFLGIWKWFSCNSYLLDFKRVRISCREINIKMSANHKGRSKKKTEKKMKEKGKKF